MDSRAPSVSPNELPQENSDQFWICVAKLEMETWRALSAKVLRLISDSELLALTPLEAWLYRRRVQWCSGPHSSSWRKPKNASSRTFLWLC
jgi:hypothetical protein